MSRLVKRGDLAYRTERIGGFLSAGWIGIVLIAQPLRLFPFSGSKGAVYCHESKNTYEYIFLPAPLRWLTICYQTYRLIFA